MMRDVGARQSGVAGVLWALSLISLAALTTSISPLRLAAQTISSSTVQADGSVTAIPAAAPAAPPGPSGAATPASAAVSGSTAVPSQSEIAGPAELPESDLAWDLLHRRYATWYGPSGGIFLFDPRSAEPGAVRVQLGLAAFAGSDYLFTNDHIELTDQVLALNLSATRGLEFYATLANRSTSQTEPKADARTLDALGDISIGSRLGTPVGRLIDVGGDLRATLINQIGGAGFEWGATSAALRGGLSIDLQRLEHPVPLLFRFNVGYILDNSARVVKDTENGRYAKLTTGESKADETAHLVSRFERLAMNVNRLDRIAFGVGIELPLQVARRFFLHPLLEWQLGVPVNRQSYDCAYVVSKKNSGTTQPMASAEDSCYERDSGAMPMNLAFGVRVVPPVRGLSAMIGVDIGLMGTSTFVRELAPNLPWRVLFGVSYDYDAKPAPSATELAVAPAAPPVLVAPASVSGRVLGTVVTPSGAAITEARVRFLDLKLSTILTGDDGRFTSEPLPPGPVAFEVAHPDYQTTRCNAAIAPTGGDTPLSCVLAPKPLIGRIQGQITETAGGPMMGVRVTATGPTNGLAMSDASGNFVLENLTPGSYQLRLELGGYFIRQNTLQIDGRGTTQFAAALIRKPIAPSIIFSGDTIEAPTLVYATDAATQLPAAGLAAIAEIADVMLARPDIYIQVQGYGPDPQIALTRAMVVKQRLSEAGVADSHIEAVGGGRHKFRFLLHR